MSYGSENIFDCIRRVILVFKESAFIQVKNICNYFRQITNDIQHDLGLNEAYGLPAH